MSYAGISTAVMLPFGLKGKTYICHAFSNPPYPYVRPTVFDDLFADELAFLQTNLSGKRKLGKKDAVAFFSRYAGQPVLDDAMRKIADCRTAQDEDTGHAVQTACQGFISTEMAGRLANVLNLIIDKVSPAYSPACRFWPIWPCCRNGMPNRILPRSRSEHYWAADWLSC